MAESSDVKKQDPVRALADELRGRRGIESRQGILGTERVDYFRAKDFAAFFRQHPEKCLSRQPRKPGSVPTDSALEDGIRDTAGMLGRRALIKRVDRLYKKPRPGKKRLTKWPRKLEPLPGAETQTWAEDGLYMWTYDLPASPWLLIGSGALVAIVLLCCLFPLAPYQLKIVVVYISLGLVGLLLGTIALRWIIAGATWALAGRALWLLPNMLSETVGLDEAFLPLWELEEVDGSWRWWRSHMWQRGAFAATAAALVWGLSRVAPDAGELTSGARATHDQILEWLNVRDAHYKRLGEGSNDTDSSNSTGVQSGSSAGVRMQVGMPGKPGSDMRTAEAIAAAAARRAAAAASAQPPTEEVIPPFEELFPEFEEGEAATQTREAGGGGGEKQPTEPPHLVPTDAAETGNGDTAGHEEL